MNRRTEMAVESKNVVIFVDANEINTVLALRPVLDFTVSMMEKFDIGVIVFIRHSLLKEYYQRFEIFKDIKTSIFRKDTIEAVKFEHGEIIDVKILSEEIADSSHQECNIVEAFYRTLDIGKSYSGHVRPIFMSIPTYASSVYCMAAIKNRGIHNVINPKIFHDEIVAKEEWDKVVYHCFRLGIPCMANLRQELCFEFGHPLVSVRGFSFSSMIRCIAGSACYIGIDCWIAQFFIAFDKPSIVINSDAYRHALPKVHYIDGRFKHEQIIEKLLEIEQSEALVH